MSETHRFEDFTAETLVFPKNKNVLFLSTNARLVELVKFYFLLLELFYDSFEYIAIEI